jgi:hypothetical protein
LLRSIEYGSVAAQSPIGAKALLTKTKISLLIVDNLTDEILCGPFFAALTGDVGHD